jgi:hypothetical protein
MWRNLFAGHSRQVMFMKLSEILCICGHTADKHDKVWDNETQVLNLGMCTICTCYAFEENVSLGDFVHGVEPVSK